ncbi:MAG: aldo/keto reductase [Fimbriimonadia bacterium]|nr:aldo/keto reductase [Fimbriimonadia bacterium]
MKYNRLGKTGIKVSELCFGCMTLGDEADEAESIRLVNRCLEAGINFFDTANVYAEGRSEVITGKALKSVRHEVVIATKARHPVGQGPNDQGLSRLHLMAQLEISLKRLQTDYVDLYQVHRWDDETPLEETLKTLDDMVRQGKARYIGCSNFAAWHLMKALGISDRFGWERFASIQPRYNLIDRVIEMELLPACRSEGVGVIVYSPLAGGILTGKYALGMPFPEGTRGAESEFFRQKRALPHNLKRAQGIVETMKRFERPIIQTAIAWTLAHETVTSAIFGARNFEQLDIVLTNWQGALPSDEKELLDEASAMPPLN